MSLRTSLLALALLCVSVTGHAVELEGIRFEPATKVGKTSLHLNGAGVRSRFMIKAYAIALYLGSAANSLDSAMSAPGAKRIEIVPLLDLSATEFNKPLVRGLKKNLPREEFEAMQPRIRMLSEQVLALGDVKKGSRLALQWIPGSGTHVVVDGKDSGHAIEGEDLFRGLLAIWIGAEPTQDDLKAQLLAGRADH